MLRNRWLFRNKDQLNLNEKDYLLKSKEREREIKRNYDVVRVFSAMA